MRKRLRTCAALHHQRPRLPALIPSSTDTIQAKLSKALRKVDSLFSKMRGAWTRLVNKVPSFLKNNSWFTEVRPRRWLARAPVYGGVPHAKAAACVPYAKAAAGAP